MISEEKNLLAGSDDGKQLQDRLDHFMSRLQQRMEPFTRQSEPAIPESESGVTATAVDAVKADSTPASVEKKSSHPEENVTRTAADVAVEVVDEVTEASVPPVDEDLSWLSHFEEKPEPDDRNLEPQADESASDESRAVDQALASISVLEVPPQESDDDVPESRDESAPDKALPADEAFGVYKIRELNVPETSGAESPSKRAIQIIAAVAVAALLLWIVWPAGEGVVDDEKPVPVAEKPVKVAAKPVLVQKEAEPVKAATEVINKKTAVLDKGEQKTVAVSVGNVRAKPDPAAKVLFTLKKGDVVTALESKQGWHRIVNSDGRKAWAYESLFIEPEEPGKDQPNKTVKADSVPAAAPIPAKKPAPALESEPAPAVAATTPVAPALTAETPAPAEPDPTAAQPAEAAVEQP
ncbi:MAG: hypothetical protein CO187_09385 [Zetaproteobacteria bacterium CG_4_9_14_3_um_filter_53_7]|nr:MAG: hypothetical protein CO187_09385 [Zetaproteobacteria bacterium CG_4_9_14_3_um_filter_53_7]